jgi:hypothetical protein
MHQRCRWPACLVPPHTTPAGGPGAAFVFTYLRLSSAKLLTWARGSSYQSKDIAWMQKVSPGMVQGGKDMQQMWQGEQGLVAQCGSISWPSCRWCAYPCCWNGNRLESLLVRPDDSPLSHVWTCFVPLTRPIPPILTHNQTSPFTPLTPVR